MEIPIVEGILSANDQVAAANRALLDRHGILMVNVMASPGSGKTSLILKTIEALREQARVGVIEGDIASRVDADRVAEQGVPVVQINTGGQCHLDAPMVSRALQRLPLDQLDLVFVENVGNLICPVGFKLGEDLNVAIASVPEGDDKPYKYPGVFVAVDAIIVNKIDLLPYLRFDLAGFHRLVEGMNPDAGLFDVSCETGQGIEDWARWLLEQRKKRAR